jgi:hypothetical protein
LKYERRGCAKSNEMGVTVGTAHAKPLFHTNSLAMRTKVLHSKLLKPLCERHEDLAYAENIVYLTPVNHLLRGFSFGRSRDPMAFYVSEFVQPMYVPLDLVHYLFGDDLDRRRALTWTLEDMPKVMDELAALVKRRIKEFLKPIESPADFAKYALRERDRCDCNVAEALAYSYIMTRAFPRAQRELNRLIEILTNNPVNWGAPMIKRARLLLKVLDRSPDAACRRLLEYECYTKTEIGLPAGA